MSAPTPPSVTLAVNPANILDGGWQVIYSLYGLSNPETITLRLLFGEKCSAIQVKGNPWKREANGGRGYQADLKSGRLAKLQEILEIFAEQEAWSTTINMQVACEKDGVTYKSEPVPVLAPAKPLNKLSLTAIRNDQHVYYLRDRRHFEGRLITKVGERYYFAYRGDITNKGGRFETEEINRGMDCTTFVMSMFELRGSLSGLDGYDIYRFFGSAADQVKYSPYEDVQRQISRLRVEDDGKYVADKIGVGVVNLLLNDLVETRRLHLFACQHHVLYQLGDTFHEFNTNSKSGQQMISGYKFGKISNRFNDMRSPDKWSIYRIDKNLLL